MARSDEEQESRTCEQKGESIRPAEGVDRSRPEESSDEQCQKNHGGQRKRQPQRHVVENDDASVPIDAESSTTRAHFSSCPAKDARRNQSPASSDHIPFSRALCSDPRNAPVGSNS